MTMKFGLALDCESHVLTLRPVIFLPILLDNGTCIIVVMLCLSSTMTLAARFSLYAWQFEAVFVSRNFYTIRMSWEVDDMPDWLIIFFCHRGSFECCSVFRWWDPAKTLPVFQAYIRWYWLWKPLTLRELRQDLLLRPGVWLPGCMEVSSCSGVASLPLLLRVSLP